jgi:hypothetical protein
MLTSRSLLSLLVTRFDDDGVTVYYVPRTRPWDRHYEKPPGLITCGICLQFFAIRFCDECTELGAGWFCYDCHAYVFFSERLNVRTPECLGMRLHPTTRVSLTHHSSLSHILTTATTTKTRAIRE